MHVMFSGVSRPMDQFNPYDGDNELLLGVPLSSETTWGDIHKGLIDEVRYHQHDKGSLILPEAEQAINTLLSDMEPELVFDPDLPEDRSAERYRVWFVVDWS